jgi:glycosyltransferase involved in cell wall biosynthesis
MNSVFSQSFDDFEFIIIDGGSTDGSLALLQKYSDKIDYWVSEKDKGIYHAMNKGIKASKGEYLLFLNGGDELLHPDILKEAFNRIGTDKKDLVYFDIKYEMEYGRHRVNTFPDHPTLKYMVRGYLPHQATFIKRELFEADSVGLYDENHPIASDWKFFVLALFKFKASYKYIPLTLSFFRHGGISTTMDKETKLRVKNWRESLLQSSFPDEFKKVKRQLTLEDNIRYFSGYQFLFGVLKGLRRRIFNWTRV